MTESHRIEYKRELTDSLEKEVVAFLNAPEGGVVYLGIDKSNKVFGVENADEIQLKVKDRLKNNIQPSCMGLFDVLLESREGKQIVKVAVASGPEKPYYLKKYGMSEKGCFTRIGSACEPMPSRMIEEWFAKRTRNSISRIRASQQDLHFEQLRIYYQEKGFNLGDKFAANLELLTEQGEYNYAAYLLADQNGNSVKVAKYRGLDREDLIESEEYGFCSLIKSCKQVLDRLEVENRTVTRITSKERITRRLWNAIALREAVINALIHNDYTNEAAPKIELFDDRIEITSAGTITPGLAQEEFFSGYSLPRNKVLMRVFKDLGFVEYLGSGLPRILKSYPRESFIFTPNFIRARFPVDPLALEVNQEKETSEKASEKASEKTSEKTADRVVQLIAQNPSITISALAEALSISTRAIEMQIKALKAGGHLQRIGGRKRGHWETKVLKKKSD